MLVALAVGPTVLPAVAAAQTTPTPGPGAMTPQAALTEAVQLAIDYNHVTAQLETVQQNLTLVQARLNDAQAAYQGSLNQYAADEGALNVALRGIRGRAVATYERSSNLINSTLEIQHAGSLTTGEQYAEAAALAGDNEVTRLKDQLAGDRDDRDAKADTIRSLETQLTVLNTQLDTLQAQAASDQIAIQNLGGVPVMGQSLLSAQQIAGWYHSTGATARLADGTTIDDLTQIYIQEGQAANVRGDVAFAQAIIETGSFEHATDNNYAGIGACDSCVGEPAFLTPRDGVRAQVQLLRSYADPTSTATNLGYPPDPTLFGADPASAAATFDSFYLKGTVPLWNEMGHGNWATDPNYAGKVLRVYQQMLNWAATNQ
ncbi:MAG TPA: glucosaminidase domain-containing protein [Vicinamibacteria bacterium]|nr:glucosaminidase domain-containing protein [Vicinamibacteria bacterium]